MTLPAPLFSCRPETFRIQNQQPFPGRALLSSLSRWYRGTNISPPIAQVIRESRVCSSPAEATDLDFWVFSVARTAHFQGSERQVCCAEAQTKLPLTWDIWSLFF